MLQLGQVGKVINIGPTTKKNHKNTEQTGGKLKEETGQLDEMAKCGTAQCTCAELVVKF